MNQNFKMMENIVSQINNAIMMTKDANKDGLLTPLEYYGRGSKEYKMFYGGSDDDEEDEDDEEMENGLEESNIADKKKPKAATSSQMLDDDGNTITVMKVHAEDGTVTTHTEKVDKKRDDVITRVEDDVIAKDEL